MEFFDLTTVSGLIVVSFCVATAALIATSHFAAKRQNVEVPSFDPHEFEPAVFLFDGTLLVDATDRAHHILRGILDGGSPWEQLMAFLAGGFPDVEIDLQELSRGDTIDRWSSGEHSTPMRLMAEWRNGMMRITVVQSDENEAVVAIDAQNLFAMERDVALLRTLTDTAPCLVWKSRRQDGAVTWANKTYFDLARDTLGEDAAISWPPPRLFAPVADVDLSENALQRRVSLKPRDGDRTLWFDTETHEHGEEYLNFALNADSAVRAEGALREFIQTLAKTFAHLPIGLAIFSRDRRLALFNPALTDLSTLPVDFLSAKPSLSAFLDELRNRQVVPEPKNYSSWRQQITALEAEAVRGTYSETWTLPSGKTYRVTGRPHPEGAIGFLFEDISSEVTLTRRFRTDTELGQAILDAVPEAIAVFSLHGQLVQSNAAYTTLWGLDPNLVIGEVSIVDAWQNWNAACEATPVWGRVRDFVGASGHRSEWAGTVTKKSGGELSCRLVPLPGGRTLVGFSPAGAGRSFVSARPTPDVMTEPV